MNIQEWIENGKPWNIILYGDCMELVELLPDKISNLAIVDPPYGIGEDASRGGKQYGKAACMSKKYIVKNWDSYPPDSLYFNELFRISQNQIIFGANNFSKHLPFSTGWIFWDKDNSNNCYSDGELAFSSFNKGLRKFKYTWNGMIQQNMKNKEIRIHPTQKPVALYRWLLQNYAKLGDKIIDTHSGSGSCAIACYLEGFEFLAIEKDFDYWKTSVERFKTIKSQGRLFI